MIEMLSSRLKSIIGTHYGLARRCVKPSYVFWTIFITNLAVSYIDKLYYFDGMVKQIYPSALQLNKANASDTEALFTFAISDGFVSSKIYDGSSKKLSVKLTGAWWSVFGRTDRGLTVGLLLLQRFRVSLLLSTHLVSSQWWILMYMFAVLIHWWVKVLHVDRTMSMCIWTTSEPRVKLLQWKTGLTPPPPPK